MLPRLVTIDTFDRPGKQRLIYENPPTHLREHHRAMRERCDKYACVLTHSGEKLSPSDIC